MHAHNKKYKAIVYRDAEKAHYEKNPSDYIIEEKWVDASTLLTIPIVEGGGCAISIFQK